MNTHRTHSNRPRRLVLDVDYHDLALHGYGRAELERLFERSASAGVKTMIWDAFWLGCAGYHSRKLPMYSGQDRIEGSARAAALYRQFDPLATAVELGKKHRITILAYFRLFDSYWPGLVDTAIDRMEHGWWESRCGQFQLRGWPCYSLPEVRQHHLDIVSEIAALGVDGFMFGLTRSHTFYASPYRQPLFFGYNQPIADEYARRYGVDIRHFDYLVHRTTNEGHFGKSYWPFAHETEYIGAQPFDLAKWHWLKGEGVAEFLREARKLLGRDRHVAIEAMAAACPPVADPNDPIPARFFVDPVALAHEGTINEWVVPENARGVDFHARLLPTFQGVRDAGAEINLWLNDVLTPDGGGSSVATIPQIERYLQTVTASDLTSFTVHEADFIEQHPQADAIWNMLRQFFG